MKQSRKKSPNQEEVFELNELVSVQFIWYNKPKKGDKNGIYLVSAVGEGDYSPPWRG